MNGQRLNGVRLYPDATAPCWQRLQFRSVSEDTQGQGGYELVTLMSNYQIPHLGWMGGGSGRWYSPRGEGGGGSVFKNIFKWPARFPLFAFGSDKPVKFHSAQTESRRLRSKQTERGVGFGHRLTYVLHSPLRDVYLCIQGFDSRLA